MKVACLQSIRSSSHRLRPLAVVVLAVVVAALGVARFLYIEADPPAGITWSGELYTDEGWYTKAAVQAVRTGHWYQAGDFTVAPNLPLGQVAYYAWFSVFGVSLASARAMVAFASLCIAAGLFMIAQRFVSTALALVTSLLVLGNFAFFAYSRLALLEMPMLGMAVWALALLVRAPFPLHLRWTIGSAVLLLAALLTKTQAVFAYPALVAVVWMQTRPGPDRWWNLLALSAVPAAGMTLHAVLASSLYPQDYRYFLQINVAPRLLAPAAALRHVEPTLRAYYHCQPLASLLLMLAAPLAAADPDTRRSPAFLGALAMLGGHFGVMCFANYQPPRYFLPVVVPAALLFSLAASAMLRRRNPAGIILFVALLAWGAHDGRSIVDYLSSPKYSFLNMARSVQEQMAASGSSSVLMGQFADSIALASNVRAVNSETGPVPVSARLERYHPTHYVNLERLPDRALRQVRAAYRLDRLRSYDVLGNYKGGRVQLYQLSRKAGPARAVRLLIEDDAGRGAN